MKKSVLALLSALVIVALVLSACAPQQSAGPAPAAPAQPIAEKAPEAPTAQPVTPAPGQIDTRYGKMNIQELQSESDLDTPQIEPEPVETPSYKTYWYQVPAPKEWMVLMGEYTTLNQAQVDTYKSGDMAAAAAVMAGCAVVKGRIEGMYINAQNVILSLEHTNYGLWLTGQFFVKGGSALVGMKMLADGGRVLIYKLGPTAASIFYLGANGELRLVQWGWVKELPQVLALLDGPLGVTKTLLSPEGAAVIGGTANWDGVSYEQAIMATAVLGYCISQSTDDIATGHGWEKPSKRFERFWDKYQGPKPQYITIFYLPQGKVEGWDQLPGYLERNAPVLVIDAGLLIFAGCVAAGPCRPFLPVLLVP